MAWAASAATELSRCLTHGIFSGFFPTKSGAFPDFPYQALPTDHDFCEKYGGISLRDFGIFCEMKMRCSWDFMVTKGIKKMDLSIKHWGLTSENPWIQENGLTDTNWRFHDIYPSGIVIQWDLIKQNGDLMGLKQAKWWFTRAYKGFNNNNWWLNGLPPAKCGFDVIWPSRVLRYNVGPQQIGLLQTCGFDMGLTWVDMGWHGSNQLVASYGCWFSCSSFLAIELQILWMLVYLSLHRSFWSIKRDWSFC